MDSRRSALEAGIRGMLPILLGVVPFGMITGTATVAVGLSPLAAIGMSLCIFAGMAQLATVELLGKNAPWLVIVGTALVVNLRFVMYSASLAPHFGGLPFRWKGPLTYLLSDQAYVVAISRFDEVADPAFRKWFYLGAAATLWSVWQMAFAAGALVGATVPSSWSLDFAVPLTLLALMPASIRDRAAIITVIATGVATWFAHELPLNLGTIVAVAVGIGAGALYLHWRGEPVMSEGTA
ncbi:MAG: membrane protein [Gemmatimonadota bacterium]|nr:MAG: membrane protein [Gemmatimonadota bacterium]